MTQDAGATKPPVVRAAAESPPIVEEWGSLTWLAGAQQTGCTGITLGRVVIKRGHENPRHSHPNCREVLYLMAGRLRHDVDGHWVTLEPGDTIVIECGVPHHAGSVGGVDADMIVAYDSGDRRFVPAPPSEPARRNP